MDAEITRPASRWQPLVPGRRSGGILGLLLLLLLLGVGLRLALPHWAKTRVNLALDDLGDYHGQVEDIDIHLWRGAYTLQGLRIVKASGKVPVPFVESPVVDISLSWREIFHGGIVGKVVFGTPHLNFVDGAGNSDGQTGRGVDWRKALEDLVPIRLDEVRVVDGTVAFRAFKTTPPVDMEATQVDAVITNLTNVRGAGGRRVASIRATANVLGRAPLQSHATFDPFTHLDDFVFDLSVSGIEAVRLNPVLQAYAHIDVTSGRGEFTTELEAKNGILTGYAKPLLKDLNVLSWQQDVKTQKDNPLRLAWEAMAGGIVALFKNQSSDQFATRIPIHGNLANPRVSRWDALVAIFHNAFVEAFKPQLEKGKPG